MLNRKMNSQATNSLLKEVEDLYLGDKNGGSDVIATVSLTVSVVGLTLAGSNIASQKYDCGVLATVSAECRKSHKAC